MARVTSMLSFRFQSSVAVQRDLRHCKLTGTHGRRRRCANVPAARRGDAHERGAGLHPRATKHIGDLMSVDTTVKKVSGQASPHGEMDQTYLVSGKRVSLRLWRNEKPQKKPATRRDYETVGYVLSGQAELVVEGQTVMLEPGDSWLVPAGAAHAYRILTELPPWKRPRHPRSVHG